ncbi:ComEA family DNA-binding protein [Halomonas sp. TRM85114]|uniref:ComEA family DNA-binding protein n=1 Tax=Halomonas jincaotanensis TaxID=2810616 RepID=UPI001BD394A7|nr:ComEA family DNA-binding protein [Halomonas jincaotanensis]MBS9402308.1 ComEA family DNA-binding protein [Halomonas jincaotanensis]
MQSRFKGTLAASLCAFLLAITPLTILAQEVAPIDVNAANAELLTELPGIGQVKASAIVENRETNGPFESADDLSRVDGIGEATVKGLRDQVEF